MKLRLSASIRGAIFLTLTITIVLGARGPAFADLVTEADDPVPRDACKRLDRLLKFMLEAPAEGQLSYMMKPLGEDGLRQFTESFFDRLPPLSSPRLENWSRLEVKLISNPATDTKAVYRITDRGTKKVITTTLDWNPAHYREFQLLYGREVRAGKGAWPKRDPQYLSNVTQAAESSNAYVASHFLAYGEELLQKSAAELQWMYMQAEESAKIARYLRGETESIPHGMLASRNWRTWFGKGEANGLALQTDVALGLRHYSVHSKGALGETASETFDESLDLLLAILHRSKADPQANNLFGTSLSVLSPNAKPFHLHVLDAASLNQPFKSATTGSWQKAPTTIRDYVFGRYAQELNLTPGQRTHLRRISEATQARSEYLFITDEPFDFSRRAHTVEGLNQPFHVRGAMTIVYSKGAHEPLPLESFTGFRIPRAENEVVAEIGRFTVDPDLRPVGPKTIWKAASVLARNGKADRIVAEVAQTYGDELIRKFGLRKIHERANFEGKVEYIIEITPEEFLKNATLPK